jgi:hypothetical protein
LRLKKPVGHRQRFDPHHRPQEAGLVLFSIRPEERNAYQALFGGMKSSAIRAVCALAARVAVSLRRKTASWKTL